MTNQMTNGLTGDALLARVKELGHIDMPKAELARACGYGDADGVDFTGFYNELLKAKGVDPTALDDKIAFGDTTFGQMTEWWKNNRPDIGQFGDDGLVAAKYGALQTIMGLAGYHAYHSRNEDIPEDQRKLWAEDAEKLEDIENRLRGIQINANDAWFAEYEDKDKLNIAAMNLMLTDPDRLEEYARKFFGPEGPYQRDIFKSENDSDPYLSKLSDDSLEVLKHFGGEAPALLNKYSCAVEDALIEQVQRCNALAERIKELTGEAPELDGESVRKALELKNALQGDTQSSEHECPEPNWKTTQENK